MPDEVVPALAPHVYVLATITEATFNFLHLVVCRLVYGLRRRVLSSTSRLGHPLAGGVVGVDVQRCAKEQSSISSKKKSPKNVSRTLTGLIGDGSQ